MNHKLWNAVGIRVIALSLLIAGATACDSGSLSNTRAHTPEATPASPSAVVVGTPPAAPSGDPPGTTPVAGNTTEIDKVTETTRKPQEGDNHSYSTVAPHTPQKADGKNLTGDAK